MHRSRGFSPLEKENPLVTAVALDRQHVNTSIGAVVRRAQILGRTLNNFSFRFSVGDCVGLTFDIIIIGI